MEKLKKKKQRRKNPKESISNINETVLFPLLLSLLFLFLLAGDQQFHAQTRQSWCPLKHSISDASALSFGALCVHSRYPPTIKCGLEELFRLTTKEEKLTVERDMVRAKTEEFSSIQQSEQDPVRILNALLPLYLNSQILRVLQESLTG